MCRVILLVALFLLVPVIAHAQAPYVGLVLNPTQVDFVPSDDHNAISLATNTPVVTSYEVSWVAMNTLGAIAVTKNIGKPIPVPTVLGATTLHIVMAIPEFATLTPEVAFTATVAAKGPGGSGVSDASNPFGIAGTPRKPAAPMAVKVNKP